MYVSWRKAYYVTFFDCSFVRAVKQECSLARKRDPHLLGRLMHMSDRKSVV